MEEICSIKLFESDLESMLSQVIAKARSRDEYRICYMRGLMDGMEIKKIVE